MLKIGDLYRQQVRIHGWRFCVSLGRGEVGHTHTGQCSLQLGDQVATDSLLSLVAMDVDELIAPEFIVSSKFSIYS